MLLLFRHSHSEGPVLSVLVTEKQPEKLIPTSGLTTVKLIHQWSYVNPIFQTSTV